MVMDTGITAPLFAAPSIVAEVAAHAGAASADDPGADDGSLLIRSTEPLAG